MLLYSKQMITENVFIEISAFIYLSNEHKFSLCYSTILFNNPFL